MKNTITKVSAMMILDSRGLPTVQARVETEGGAIGVAAVPSGASTGKYEAVEKRDGGKSYMGKGVENAINGIYEKIAPALTGMNVFSQWELDRTMLSLDNTENKGKLGANAILAVSLACARAAANARGCPLFRYIGGLDACILPVPMMNVLNGGAHADNPLDFQEFMIMPVGAKTFSQGLEMGVQVYHALKELLRERGLSTAVGDEGGFAPEIENEFAALELLSDAVLKAGLRPGEDIVFALDVAASEWIDGDGYLLPKSGRKMSREELIETYRRLCSSFPIRSIEDPLGEEDFDGFRQLTSHFAGKVQIVGDDLFVTNARRLWLGIQNKSASAILIKPNQVGTLSETLKTIRLAKAHGYAHILSHRSGETEDTTIADLTVALGGGQIKAGAPCRSERTSKYNRLLCIEQMLGESAQYGSQAVDEK